MATDKIDVKADAREIANKYYKCSGHESRNEDGDDYNELVSELVTFASRVRDEAAREAVERIEKLLMMNSCGCLHAIRSACAEPGKEQEPRDIGKERCVPLVHGVNCLKVQHTRPHMHEPDDDSPYPVDDVWYCGRCHFAITPPAVPALTLRQFVDAAVRLADAHMEYPASGHPDDMADTETILRLAPQFREQAP